MSDERNETNEPTGDDNFVTDLGKQLESWPKVIKLKHPIELGKETYTELTFRRGRLGDLRGVKISKDVAVDDLIKIASRMCGETTGVLERLDVEDSGEVVAIALGFIGQSLGG